MVMYQGVRLLQSLEDLTTRAVQWRRHGVSDTQFWESRGTTNRKVKEWIVFSCGTAIHQNVYVYVTPFYPFKLEEEIKGKWVRFSLINLLSKQDQRVLCLTSQLGTYHPDCLSVSDSHLPGAACDHLLQRQEQPRSDKHQLWVSLGWGSASLCWPHCPGYLGRAVAWTEGTYGKQIQAYPSIKKEETSTMNNRFCLTKILGCWWLLQKDSDSQ